MENVIQRCTAYFGKEDEATRIAGDIKSSNVDSEQKSAHLVHWKHLGLICTVVQQFGFHGGNPQYPIS